MRMLASAVRPATVQVAWEQSLYVFSDVFGLLLGKNSKKVDGIFIDSRVTKRKQVSNKRARKKKATQAANQKPNMNDTYPRRSQKATSNFSFRGHNDAILGQYAHTRPCIVNRLNGVFYLM